MRSGRLIIPSLGFALLASLAHAQQAETSPAKGQIPPLVGHQALESRLGESNLRLLDVRPLADYKKGHIPGAVWLDSKGASALAGKPGGLADAAAWEAWAAPLGIGEGTEVLIYGGKSPVDTARAWWLLRYLGAERVGLVDGGFPLWVEAKRPVSTEEHKVAPKAFKVRFLKDRLATKEDVLVAIKQGSSQIVDARSLGEFTGEKLSSKRGGHVPTACHLEWSDLVDKDGRFLDGKTLREKMNKAGLKSDAPAITHCQGGGRASLDAFVLERLGIPTRNYYLGWSDWGNQESTPVVKGKESK